MALNTFLYLLPVVLVPYHDVLWLFSLGIRIILHLKNLTL